MIDSFCQKHSIRLSHQAQRGDSFFKTVNLGPFQLSPRAIKLNPGLKEAACLKSYESPNIEELIRLKIDTVFYWSWPKQIRQMQNAGIAVVCPLVANRRGTSIEEFLETATTNISFYQGVFGRDNNQKLEAYKRYFDYWANRILKITSKIERDHRPKVYYVGGQNIFKTHGMDTNTYWYVKLAGGELIPASKAINSTISAEDMVVFNPHIILMGRLDSTAPVTGNPQLAGIDAVSTRLDNCF